MTWTTKGQGGVALRLGPEQNTFEGVDQADAELARDTYFTANPTNLAAYDSNTNFLIRLIYPDTERAMYRFNNAWQDYTPFLQGLPGEVASLVNVPVGEVPYKLPNGTFGGSRLRVLDDNSLLAPPEFGVESGSIAFGDVLLLSEAAGFLAIQNNINDKSYTIVDYATPRNAAHSNPTTFLADAGGVQFVAQPVDTTNIPDTPLIFNYTIQNTGRTYSLKMRTYAPMSNVRIRISLVSNDVALKYIPTKEAWETELGGLEWALGDNEFDFGDTPLIFTAGQLIKFEIQATQVALKGNASNIPWFGGFDQICDFQDVLLVRDYTATDVRNKLQSLVGVNRLPITAIRDAVTSVAGRTGDVVLSATDVSGLATVATTGAYSSLSGLPTIPTQTSQLTNNSGFITAAGAPVQSVNGYTGTVVLVKADLGLGNVDNTSDVNKPVSTAQQAAIDLKMTQHNAAADPHPQYTTTAEAAAAAPVQSVNGSTGAVVLNTGNVAESGNLYYTDTRVQTYLTNTGYTVKSMTNGGSGAGVYNTNVGGLVTLRRINGTGLITVTENASDITIAIPTVVGGVFTPTVTNVTNVSSSTAFQCQYMRVDGVVTVSGKVTIDPSSNGAITRVGITLPVASDFGVEQDCCGTSACSDIQQSGAIMGDTTNNRATLEFLSTSSTSRTHFFQFTYRII